jgi:hypothetical protein
MPARNAADYEESVARIDEVTNWGDISIDNGWVCIRSEGVDRVVAEGPAIVPYVLRWMRKPGISFDRFVRCYSACDQILRKVDPSTTVYWNGGAAPAGDWREGRLEPRFQADNAEFRQRVIADIERAHLAVGGARSR